MPMKLKLDADGHVVVQDGKPMYVHDDGHEAPFDAEQTVSTISRLNAEAKKHREEKEAAEGKLKQFEGIEDPEAAKAAIETVKNIKDGDLIAAGKVEEIKAAAKKAAEDQVAAATKKHREEAERLKADNEKKTNDLHSYMISGGFQRSKLVNDPKHPKALVIPPDMVEARFGKNFKVEDGKIIGYDAHNNKIFSRQNPAEVAEFDEALELLVESYPYKDQILRGSGARGDGAKGGQGGGGPDDKTMTRAEFNRLQREIEMAKGRGGPGPAPVKAPRSKKGAKGKGIIGTGKKAAGGMRGKSAKGKY
jgi:hypothetical protein